MSSHPCDPCDDEFQPDVAGGISESHGHFDQARAEAAVRELLLAVGEGPDREGLRETPARVARAYREIFQVLRTLMLPAALGLKTAGDEHAGDPVDEADED